MKVFPPAFGTVCRLSGRAASTLQKRNARIICLTACSVNVYISSCSHTLLFGLFHAPLAYRRLDGALFLPAGNKTYLPERKGTMHATCAFAWAHCLYALLTKP